jgi:hypothetical protein
MGSEQYRFSARPHSALARSRVALLGAWAGAMIAFGGLFVPAAFSHLPTQLAASVLGDGFAALDRWGIALGLVCVALGVADRQLRGERGAADLLRAWLPLAGVFAHATSALWVSPDLHQLRVAAGGSIGQLPTGGPELAQFAWLHSLSRALFALAAGSAALAAVWDLWRLDARPVSGASPDAGTS